MADPYTIDVPDSAIDDLKQRLKLARFPDELDGAGWDLGAPLADIKRLTAYWRDEYDWRKSERKLNALPNFTTSIHVDGFDPLSIHYLHSKSPVATAIPLLYVHGWPGSFLEGTKILPLLSSGDGASNPAFDVVVISLPNFGFSEAPSKRGFALNQYAECCHKLMLKLGYPQYVTQGGDWGYYITRTMALLYPNAVRATHINFDYGGGAPTFSEYPLLALEHSLRPYSEREVKGMERTKWFMEEGSGYRAISATKPQTLAYALQDSPVGWLAWVYEKLVEWTDGYAWTDEEVCEWVCVHWFSRAGIAASLRIYYESTHPSPSPSPSPPSTTTNLNPTTAPPTTRLRTGEWIPNTPIGYSHQPRELRIVPSTWYRKLGPIVFDRHNESGGHFWAWECPEGVVGDLRDMFRKPSGIDGDGDVKGEGIGGAFGVVEGRGGYGL